ncbi:MAG: hypothetical protein HYY52_02485 [Candidatus Melainabacteria bacterium]|nr:hypothetical protein [Candidatus Melainabacteria bacterium]
MKSRRILFYVLMVFMLSLCFSLAIHTGINAQDDDTTGTSDDDTDGTSDDDTDGASNNGQGDEGFYGTDEGLLPEADIPVEEGEDYCEPNESYDFSKLILLPAVAAPGGCYKKCTYENKPIKDKCVSGSRVSTNEFDFPSFECTTDALFEKCDRSNDDKTCSTKFKNRQCWFRDVDANNMIMIYFGTTKNPLGVGCVCK